jgi:hypothetical protein
MKRSSPLLKANTLISSQKRCFGAMDQLNKELFEHKFTEQMDFKSSFEKFKCFRVLDEEGNLINKPYENSISADKL